jgi:hypothetical protein
MRVPHWAGSYHLVTATPVLRRPPRGEGSTAAEPE